MKRIPARRAVLVAAALVLSSVVPGLGMAAGAAEPNVSLGVNLSDPTFEPEDLYLLDGSGDEIPVASYDHDEDRFIFEVPPGRYDLHLEALVPTYWAGFKSGDASAPGLFIDVPLDLSNDVTLDLTVPLVEFPVHVTDRDGQPVADVRLEGTSQASVLELAPGVVGTGRVFNHLAVRTDGNGNAAMLMFAGAPPAPVRVTDAYETLGQAFPAPSATSATVVLDSPTLQGRLLDSRGPLSSPAVENAWVAFQGGVTYPGQFAPWPYGTTNGAYRLQAYPGDRTLSLSNRDVYDRGDPADRPPTATLPGTWTFDAPYRHTADATLDLTIPDAAPADIVVLGADDQPVTDTMDYEAVALSPVELAPGLAARAAASDTIANVQGHFSPMLFGPSTFRFVIGGGPLGPPITVSPGDHLTFRLADQSGRPGAPQNVTATAGDGKVKVTWEAPASDGGSPITGYTVTASRGSSNFKANFDASATSGTIRSLVNGKDYSVTVVAKNADGSGAASAAIRVTLDAVDPPTTTTTAPANPGPGSGDQDINPLGGAGDGAGIGTPASGRSGYWLLGSDGAVYPFGDAAPHGDASAALAAASMPSAGAGGPAVKAVDLEATPSGGGYWVLDSRGRIHPFGDAGHFGDAGPFVDGPTALAAGEAPSSLSATPSGAGYWVFTSQGRALAFGDAPVLGDMVGTTLNGPVLDSVATPSGRGYYMVASDGGIFAFGDARFAGSMGGRPLNSPVQSLVPMPDHALAVGGSSGGGAPRVPVGGSSGGGAPRVPGYWLAAADGGVFAFDAPFRGSMGGRSLNKPVRGMVRYGDGYLMVGEDGGIFAFSDRPFTGSLGARPPASPIVSVSALG